MKKTAAILGVFCWMGILFSSPAWADSNPLPAETPVTETSAIEEAPATPPTDEFDSFGQEFKEITTEEVFDPLSGYNRFMTHVNDKVYFWGLQPVARGYRWLVPEPGRQGMSNFFENIFYPVRVTNNLLQTKFKNAGEETLRFVINVTIGVFGLWDPATDCFGLEAHDEDFGQTLGYYGVGSGFPVVLPLLGPSNLRDSFSLVPDNFVDPITLEVDGLPRQLGVRVFKAVNRTSLHLGEYESIRNDAFDLYTFLRDAYEQNRQKNIEE